jgi:hypothetical protein
VVDGARRRIADRLTIDEYERALGRCTANAEIGLGAERAVREEFDSRHANEGSAKRSCAFGLDLRSIDHERWTRGFADGLGPAITRRDPSNLGKRRRRRDRCW